MSNAGQAITAIVGGVAGFFIGGPQGAAYGFQLGLLAGSALFPTQLPGVTGPRLDDLRTTTSEVGAPVPIVYGTIAVPGVVIWLDEAVEHSETDEVGGKGGPEQDVTTFTYTQSIAIGLCEGPIGGVLRIWENGKLVYDRRPQQDGEDATTFANRITASDAYEQDFTLYVGDEDQLPDPTIEIDKGVGNVPAFRGLAYIVYPDRLLHDDQARRHPNFRFEVYKTGLLECEEGTEYSNEVLYDWLTPGNPVNSRNTHIFTTAGGISGTPPAPTDNLASLLVECQASRGWDEIAYVGAAIGRNALGDDQLLDSVGGPDFSDQGSYMAYLHYCLTVPDLYIQHTEALHCITNPGPLASPGTIFYTHEAFPPGLVEVLPIDGSINLPVPQPPAAPWPLASRCNNLYWYQYDPFDVVIRAERFPSPPADPCDGLPDVDGLPGYCEIDGLIHLGGPWTLDESQNYHVLQEFHADLGIPDPAINITRYPLNPARPVGHADDNQTFWEAAYAAAVDAGEMDLGLTYGVDYPEEQDFGYVREYARCTIISGGATLGQIIQDLCGRVGLTNLDAGDLDEIEIDGFAIGRPMPARQAIETLKPVGYFDIVESAQTVRFRTRGKAAVLSLTSDELGAYEGTVGPAITTHKVQDVELPRQVRVHYIATSRDYEAGEQASPSRLTTDSVNDVDVEIAVAMSDTRAAQIAEVLWADAWHSRWLHEFTLDTSFSELECADVVWVPVDDRVQRVRIVSIDDSIPLIRRLSTVRDDDGSYVSHAVASAPDRPPNLIVFYGPTELILLDLPALRDVDDDAGIYAAARRQSGSTWNGAVIYRSIDSGATFAQIASITTEATICELVDPLPAGITTTWDDANEIVVRLLSGSLESRTEEAVLNGANALAIGAHQRWMIVQFTTVEQVTESIFRLSHLLNGRRGTEHFAGTSQAGDNAVLISSGGIIRLPLQNAEIGATRIYKAVTIGTSYASGIDQSFAGNGLALETFSPVDIAGVREDNGDITITWIRRGRLGQELPSGADIPLSEESESYEVDIVAPGSPDSVLRTLASATQTVIYTAAQQSSDFGSPVPDEIHIRVYQLSAIVGRGTPGEAFI